MKVRSILVSQPEPQPGEPSPFLELAKIHKIKVDFRPFIQVKGLDNKEIRLQKIDLSKFTSVIFTSKNAVDHFFRIAEELRYPVPGTMKYFCLSESIANYLQVYIVYRKRKIYFGSKTVKDLYPFFQKFPNEKYLLPCSDVLNSDIVEGLNGAGIDWTKCIMFNTVSTDLSDLKDISYDILVFFTPTGIKSLFENFPNFKQGNTRIAVFGQAAVQAAKEAGLRVDIQPTPEQPSMFAALDAYIREANK